MILLVMYEQALSTEPHPFIFTDILNPLRWVIYTRCNPALSNLIILKLLHVRKHIFHYIKLHLWVLHICNSRLWGRRHRGFCHILTGRPLCLLSCLCNSLSSWLRAFYSELASCLCSVGIGIWGVFRVLLLGSTCLARLEILVSGHNIDQASFFYFIQFWFIYLVFFISSIRQLFRIWDCNFCGVEERLNILFL